MLHEVWDLERFQTAKVTLKVTERHWHLAVVPIDRPHTISY